IWDKSLSLPPADLLYTRISCRALLGTRPLRHAEGARISASGQTGIEPRPSTYHNQEGGVGPMITGAWPCKRGAHGPRKPLDRPSIRPSPDGAVSHLPPGSLVLDSAAAPACYRIISVTPTPPSRWTRERE